MHRNITDIAHDCLQDWKTPYFGAVPYLNAMLTLGNMRQSYGKETADIGMAPGAVK